MSGASTLLGALFIGIATAMLIMYLLAALDRQRGGAVGGIGIVAIAAR